MPENESDTGDPRNSEKVKHESAPEPMREHIETDPDGNATRQHQGRAHQKAKKWPNFLEAKWTDVAIVFLTCGIVYFAATSGSQTDEIIAADERMAKGIEETLKLSKESYAGANRQAMLSQRAWIAVIVSVTPQTPSKSQAPNETGTPLIVGKPIDIRIGMKNTGRTPAVNLRSVTERTPVERTESGQIPNPTFVYKDSEFLPAAAIEPEGVVYADFFYPTLTREDKKRIDTQAVRVYVHGRIEFDDVFGVHHWRNFCGFLLPTGAIAMCSVHNDVDNNQGG